MIEGVLLEFRNDFCADIEWRKKIIKLITPIINNLKEDTK